MTSSQRMINWMVTSSNENIFHVTGPLWGSPVDSPKKRSVTRSFDVFFLMCAWTNGWANNRDAGDLRRHCTYYDVIVLRTILTHRRNVLFTMFLVGVLVSSKDRTFDPLAHGIYVTSHELQGVFNNWSFTGLFKSVFRLTAKKNISLKLYIIGSLYICNGNPSLTKDQLYRQYFHIMASSWNISNISIILMTCRVIKQCVSRDFIIMILCRTTACKNSQPQVIQSQDCTLSIDPNMTLESIHAHKPYQVNNLFPPTVGLSKFPNLQLLKECCI